MKEYWGSGCIAPSILDFDTRWRWVVIFTTRPLYPQGKSPWYPLDRRLGGPQSLSGRGGENKNSKPLPGIETPIFQPVAQRYTTELPRLWWRLKCKCKKKILQIKCKTATIFSVASTKVNSGLCVCVCVCVCDCTRPLVEKDCWLIKKYVYNFVTEKFLGNNKVEYILYECYSWYVWNLLCRK
jgi:hypothetical protein